MTSQYIGIEEARGKLGALVTAAQQGTDIILTRNSRPVARISAYQPEDTMTTIDLTASAATVIARARSRSGLTAPEFDHDIATWFDHSVDGIGGMGSPLGSACWEIAREDAGPGQTPDEYDAAAARLWDALRPELIAYATRCRDRRYTGWSAASRSRGQRIRYAD